MTIILFSVQYSLNLDTLAANNLISKTTTQPLTVNSSLINLNLDAINQPAQVTTTQSPILTQCRFKNNLNDYFSDILNTKSETSSAKLSLNEIIQSVLSRKNYQILVNQQLRQVFQWIVDFSLDLINSFVLAKQNQNSVADLSILSDQWVLNEIRKGLVYVKLLFVYLSTVQSQQTQPQSLQQSNHFITTSLPILPLKSSMQKDLITELFNIFTKFLVKSLEGY